MKIISTLLGLGLSLLPMLLPGAEGKEGPLVRFGIVSDVHYAAYQSPQKHPNYRASLQKMQEFVKNMNREKVNFVVELGDYVGRGGPSREMVLEWLRTVEAEYGRFQGPRYHVLGNHDMAPLDKETYLNQVENTGIPYGLSYYHFYFGGIQFIVLDTDYRRDGTSYGDGRPWKETFIPAEQLSWLKRTLASHSGKSIVFMHQPLYDDGADGNVENSREVRKVLEESGKVLAVINGHYHEGIGKRINGIYYYNMRSMLNVPSENSYALMEVLPDYSIRIRGYGKIRSGVLSPDVATPDKNALSRK